MARKTEIERQLERAHRLESEAGRLVVTMIVTRALRRVWATHAAQKLEEAAKIMRVLAGGNGE